MDSAREPSTISGSRAPLREQRASILFMIFLLVVSGLTATIVGYRVKSADLDRKAQLLKQYEQLGGSASQVLSLGSSINLETLSPKQQTFALAYEVNSRARAFGLYRVIENTPTDRMQKMVSSLYEISATEAARSSDDALRAYQEPIGSQAEHKNMNPKAARFARQYDRYLARDAEVKLFTYLRDHHQEISGK
jgi:hypothetical protein